MKRSNVIAIAVVAVLAGAAAVYAYTQQGAGGGSSELLAPGALPDKVMGDANAPVTVIEYASMSCSHCAEFSNITFPAVKERYIDTGKVRFIFREFPFDGVAMAGSMIARCAGDDKYFPIVKAFFEQQASIRSAASPLEWLQSFGKQVGFTEESLNACLSNRELEANLGAVRDRAAEKFDVTSTPTFFVNGKIVRGAMTIEEFAQEVDPLLK